ncbi:hypothetical protein FNJ87_03215 [Nonlabens mediterrranea]|uniref:Lipoprotein n=2 Tax=Nonlabens mediterrranea TaxID=1419947 RepID=A0ABS0A428_9FLAO|nr:hypothetical protein [Nonlabens mediterrranea]
MKKLIAYLLLIGILSSCASVRNSEASTAVTELTNKNLNSISAIYNNKAVNGEPEFSSLWSTLNFKSDSISNWKDLTVKISVKNKKLIVAELIDDGNVIAKKDFFGNLNKEYFLLKNQTKAELGIVIIWFLGNSSVKIGLTEDDELILLRRSDGMAMLVAFPVFASNSPTIETIYKRIK